MELEQAGKWRDALSAYRAALEDSPTAAILGIERVYDQLGKRDSILPLIDFYNHLARYFVLANLTDTPFLQQNYASNWSMPPVKM